MRKSLLIVSVAVFGLSFGCGGKDAKDKPATAVDTAAVAVDTVAVVPDTAVVAPDTATTFTDSRDGKVYKIVKIGRQVWFAENLNHAAKGSKCYDNKAANCAKYGRLYNWNTALTVCPAGFHLPDDNEWYTLRDYADNQETAGTRLKSTGGWNKNGNGTDDYGFSALPGGSGGFGVRDDIFEDVNYSGLWWSATPYYKDGYVMRQLMRYNSESVISRYDHQRCLFSVRCIQDREGEE